MNLYKRNQIYWVCYRLKGQKVRASLKTPNETVARHRMAELEKSIVAAEVGAIPAQAVAQGGTITSLADLHAQYLTFLEGSRSPKGTRLAFQQAAATVDKNFDGSPLAIQKWLASQRDLKGQTINQRRSLLRKAWKWGAIHSLVWGHNPWDSVPRQPVSEPVKPEDLTDAEVEALLQATDGERRLQWLMYAFTGVRAQAGLSMRWEWIDLHSGSITVPAENQKRNRTCRIPVHPVLAQALRDWFVTCPHKPFVFEQTRGGRNTLWRQLQADLARAGIRKKCNLRGLRHTFATRALSAGENLLAVSRLLGHKNITTTQEYLHVSDEDLARVVGAMKAPTDTKQTQLKQA
jgi:integrase